MCWKWSSLGPACSGHSSLSAKLFIFQVLSYFSPSLWKHPRLSITLHPSARVSCFSLCSWNSSYQFYHFIMCCKYSCKSISPAENRMTVNNLRYKIMSIFAIHSNLAECLEYKHSAYLLFFINGWRRQHSLFQLVVRNQWQKLDLFTIRICEVVNCPSLERMSRPWVSYLLL